MKKLALGNFCLLHYIIFSFMLVASVLCLFICDDIDIKYPAFFYIPVLLLMIFWSIQIIYRVSKCYYILNDESFILSLLLMKKRKKWYDFFSISNTRSIIGAKNTLQVECNEINYKDIEKIGLLGEYRITKLGLKKDDIVLITKKEKRFYISRSQFCKKQVLEIVNTVLENNKNIVLGERLKRELKLT